MVQHPQALYLHSTEQLVQVLLSCPLATAIAQRVPLTTIRVDTSTEACCTQLNANSAHSTHSCTACNTLFGAICAGCLYH